jgi:hypothetical protein
MSNEERRGRNMVVLREGLGHSKDQLDRSRSRDRLTNPECPSIFQAIDLGDCVGIAALLKEDVWNALAVSKNEDHMNPICCHMNPICYAISKVLINESFVKVIKTLIENNGADMQPEVLRDSPLFRFLDYQRIYTQYNTWFLEILNLLVDNTFSIDTLQFCKTHLGIILVSKEEVLRRFVNAPERYRGGIRRHIEMHQISMTRVIDFRTLIEKQILLCHLKPLLY